MISWQMVYRVKNEVTTFVRPDSDRDRAHNRLHLCSKDSAIEENIASLAVKLILKVGF